MKLPFFLVVAALVVPIVPLVTEVVPVVVPVVVPGQSEILLISRGNACPDCFQAKDLLLINGSFSGPTIRFNQGDNISLSISNLQKTPLSIHIHGIFQNNSNEMDGASFITTHPIPPYKSTVIRTRLTQSGTFFYHAHIGLLDMHVYGAFIVSSNVVDEPALLGYDEDRVLVLSDYWRTRPEVLLEGLVQTPTFRFVGSPDAFLTNGHTLAADKDNCTAAAANYHVVNVEQGKRYRFRLIGASTLFPVHFSIPRHAMTLVEVDGSLIKPINVEYVEIFPGQRYSVLVSADQEVGEYWMQQVGKWRANAPTNGFSILRYNTAGVSATELSYATNTTTTQKSSYATTQSSSYATNTTTQSSYATTQSSSSLFRPPTYLEPTQNEAAGWICSQFSPLLPDLEDPLPPLPDTTLVLTGRQVTWGASSTQLRWTVNNISFTFPQDKTVREHALQDTLSSLPPTSQPYRFPQNTTVDLVFQNTVGMSGVCEAHPWHIHGHAFWHLDSGPDTYSTTHVESRFEAPVMRDTVVVYPYTHGIAQPTGTPGDGCGWARVRVVMWNVGVWALHCHIASHFAMGMGTAFVVGAEQMVYASSSSGVGIYMVMGAAVLFNL